MSMPAGIRNFVESARAVVPAATTSAGVVSTAAAMGTAAGPLGVLLTGLTAYCGYEAWRAWKSAGEPSVVEQLAHEAARSRDRTKSSLRALAAEHGVRLDGSGDLPDDDPLVLLAAMLHKPDGEWEAILNEHDLSYISVAEWIVERPEVFARLPESERVGLQELRAIRSHVEHLRDRIDTTVANKLDVIDRNTRIRPELHLPLRNAGEPRGNPFLYSHRRVPLFGRASELDQLMAFVDAPAPQGAPGDVRWWIATGSGGMGKTRLVYELCLKLRTLGWDVGFLPRSSRFSDWGRWDVCKLTLLVVDYASSRAAEVAEMLSSVGERPTGREERLRVLLLDREVDERLADALGGSDDAAANRERIRHRAEPLAVPPLDDDSLWNTFGWVLAEREVNQARSEQLLKELVQIDPQRRPLFAAIAADAAVDTQTKGTTINLRGWSREKVVKHVLDREVRNWREDEPHIDEPHANLLCLATMVRGLADDAPYVRDGNLSPMLPQFGATLHTGQRARLKAFAGAPAGRSGSLMPSLEPDILGELFILERLRGELGVAKGLHGSKQLLGTQTSDLVKVAWITEPLWIALTALLAARDYPDHPNLPDLWPPPDDNAAWGWERLDGAPPGGFDPRVAPPVVAWAMSVVDLAGALRNESGPPILAGVVSALERIVEKERSLRRSPSILARYLAEALVNRGVTYAQMTPPRTEDAIADYTRVIGLDDAPVDQVAKALFNRGVRYGKMDPPRTEDAIADYTRVIEMDGVAADILAEALFNRGITYGTMDPPRTGDAIADYTRVIEMKDAPADQVAKALFNRGVAYGTMDPPRTEDEIADYTRVIEMKDAPADQVAKALFNRGVTYAQMTPPRTEDEIADYTRVIEMKDAPADRVAKALVNRGVTYAQMTPPRTGDAMADYTRVIEMKDAPADQVAKALFNRGVAYGTMDPPRTEDAIADSTRVIGLDDAPVDQVAKALVNRGVAYGRMDPPRTEDAITDYTRVIEMDGVAADILAEALFNRGVRYGTMDPPRTEDEIADYTRVIEMKDAPADQVAKALFNRGVAYGTMDPPRTEDAIADYTRVIEMKGAPADQVAKALVGRGAALDMAGRTGAAAFDFALAAEHLFSPVALDNTVADNLAVFLTRHVDSDQAASALCSAVAAQSVPAGERGRCLYVLAVAARELKLTVGASILGRSARGLLEEAGDTEGVEAADKLLKSL